MKRLIAALLLMTVFSIAPARIGAEDVPCIVTVVHEATPFATEDDIIIKYRKYNGKWQYRRWNDTKKIWVDPYWIDL